MSDQVIAPGGVHGSVFRVLGASTQVWPSGSAGTSSEPTNYWVYGDVKYAKGANQLILWVDYDSVVRDECDIRVEYALSEDGPFYCEPTYMDDVEGYSTYMDRIRVIPSGVEVPPVMSAYIYGDYVRVGVVASGVVPAGATIGVVATIGSYM
jgi:hypothetical protein